MIVYSNFLTLVDFAWPVNQCLCSKSLKQTLLHLLILFRSPSALPRAYLVSDVEKKGTGKKKWRKKFFWRDRGQKWKVISSPPFPMAGKRKEKEKKVGTQLWPENGENKMENYFAAAATAYSLHVSFSFFFPQWTNDIPVVTIGPATEY